MQQVLVLAGCRQSGKSSSAKFIHGCRMLGAGTIDWFTQADNGDLVVKAFLQNEKGEKEEANAILDIYRRDFEFAQYAHEKIWPFIKVESFAESLKQTAIEVLGLDPENVYGTDEDKAKPTHLKWDGFWHLLSIERQKELCKKREVEWKKNTPLTDNPTNREVLQDFGTICRLFDEDCWVNACWRRIEGEGYPFIVIDDCRYLNEITISKKKNATIVLLDNQPIQDNHTSEKVLTFDRSIFDFVVENSKMSMEEKNNELIKILTQIGWTTAKLQ
jgi:hypothetical protein